MTKATGVTLNMALGYSDKWGVADLSLEENKSEKFTCSESLDLVHRLHYVSDFVLVGRETV